MADSPFLNGLNPEQREAVLHVKGPLLVLAGAGSGKTRVITHRLAHLVAGGADPRSIAAVTFTNKAASEMRERAERLLGVSPLASFVGTFHSWSLRLLRRRSREAGLPPRFSIADSSDQLALIKEAMGELSISEQVLPPGAVRARISQAKNALVSARALHADADRFRGRADRPGLRPLREEARGERRARLRRPDRRARWACCPTHPRSSRRSAGACGTC